MMIVKFKWFDAVEWNYFQSSIIAESISEAENFLRKEARVHAAPYSHGNDSLELLGVEKVSFPCFILEPKED